MQVSRLKKPGFKRTTKAAAAKQKSRNQVNDGGVTDRPGMLKTGLKSSANPSKKSLPLTRKRMSRDHKMMSKSFIGPSKISNNPS